MIDDRARYVKSKEDNEKRTDMLPTKIINLEKEKEGKERKEKEN